MTGRARRATVALAFAVAGCVGADSATVSTSDQAAPGSSAAGSTDVMTTATAAPATAPPADPSPSADATSSSPPTSAEGTIQLTGPAVVDEPATAGVRPDGFTAAMVRITEADGSTCDVCMWLADEPAERARGLMGVTDLGDAAGMAFVFEEPSDGEFYMFRTVTPLSIAFFGPDGEFVSTSDMNPCLDEQPAGCPRYGAAGSFQLAIEVFAGGLVELGIGPGARAEVLAGTEASTCPHRAG